MKTKAFTRPIIAAALLNALLLTSTSVGQPAPAPRGRGPQGSQVISPEVSADRHITFRLRAPKSEAVRLAGSDIPGNGPGATMTRGARTMFGW